MSYFQIDSAIERGVGFQPLKTITRSPGTSAGFFVPVASAWRSPGPVSRKCLGGLVIATRARSGLLSGVTEISNLKNITMNNAKSLCEEGSVCSLEECLNWIGKRVLTKTYYHQEPNPLQEGLVLGFRLILKLGESIDPQKCQKLFLVQISDSGDLVERYLEEMEVVS